MRLTAADAKKWIEERKLSMLERISYVRTPEQEEDLAAELAGSDASSGTLNKARRRFEQLRIWSIHQSFNR